MTISLIPLVLLHFGWIAIVKVIRHSCCWQSSWVTKFEPVVVSPLAIALSKLTSANCFLLHHHGDNTSYQICGHNLLIHLNSIVIISLMCDKDRKGDISHSHNLWRLKSQLDVRVSVEQLQVLRIRGRHGPVFAGLYLCTMSRNIPLLVSKHRFWDY